MAKTRKQSLKALQKEVDDIYQRKLIELKPKSVISGQPTEVIHHYIYKSQSNNLRYDYHNGVPLTNMEHNQHHLSGDPSIVAGILKHYGQNWHDALESRRRIICKINKGYLQMVREELEAL